jgi:hypothetical protein
VVISVSTLPLEVNVTTPSRSLEVGTSGGSVAAWLYEQVGPTGHVVATDINIQLLQDIEYANFEVSRSVARPGGIATVRFPTLNEIASPIVPTEATRLRPGQAETGTPLIMRRLSVLPSGTRCHRLIGGAGYCQLAGYRDTGATMPRRLATFMPHARNADHLALWIGNGWPPRKARCKPIRRRTG